MTPARQGAQVGRSPHSNLSTVSWPSSLGMEPASALSLRYLSHAGEQRRRVSRGEAGARGQAAARTGQQ